MIVANAVLWALAANKFSRGWVLLPYLVVFSVLLAVSVVDLRLYRIPDRFVFPGLAITFVLIVIASFVVLPTPSDAFTVPRARRRRLADVLRDPLLLPHRLPAGMGFGDVKLALLMGLSLGWLGTRTSRRCTWCSSPCSSAACSASCSGWRGG